MASDRALLVRKAILSTLKADADVVALVPAASIYPQSPPSSPAWPFIRYGAPSVDPISGACVDGSQITVAVHAFAKPRASGAQILESAEDFAARIGAAVSRALDRRTVDMAAVAIRLRWQGSQILQDGDEADAYHAVINIRARVLS